MARLIEFGKQSPAGPQKGVSTAEVILILGVLVLAVLAMANFLHADPTMLYRTVLGWF